MGGAALPLTFASGISETDAGTINPSLSDDTYVYTSQMEPGYTVLTQEFTVGSGSNIVFFDIAIENGADDFYVPEIGVTDPEIPIQQARVEVLKPGSDTLSVSADDIIVNAFQTQPGDPLSQDWTSVEFDVTAELSGYVGQSVIFRFTQIDNQMYMNMALDNINVGAKQIYGVIAVARSLRPDDYTLAPDLNPSNVPTCSGSKFVNGFQIVGNGQIKYYTEASKQNECFDVDVTFLPEGVSAKDMTDILTALGTSNFDIYRLQ